MNKKLLILLLILSLSLFLLMAVALIKKSKSAVIPSSTPIVIQNQGSMSLVLGENKSVNLVIDSGNEAVVGIDAVLKYDPALVSVTKITANPVLFEQFIPNLQKNKEGLAKITAYSPKTEVTARQTFAYLTIKLLTNQPATIGFEFLGENNLTDSNLLIENGQKDILGKVTPLKIEP